jgi:hypothetical protein
MITQVTTPTALTNALSSSAAFQAKMLMLPNGQMLFHANHTQQLHVYTPDVTNNPSWQPTISSIADQGSGNYILTGTRISGISEGASYGDDAQMASNYPIVQLKDGSGNIYYATTTNWSYTGVSAAGDTTAHTVNFKLPANLAAGSYSLTVIANGIASAPTTLVVGATPIPVPQTVDLSGSFNNAGIVTDGTTFLSTGGLDGLGDALSSTLLGASVKWNGNTFNLGTPTTNGQTNAIDVTSAAGQIIPLPQGSFSTLNFLATAVNGNQANQTFTINFTDGTTQTFTRSISDWFMPNNNNGESKAVTMNHRDLYTGSTDNRPFYIYGYSVTLTGGKTVQSITLPTNVNVNLIAITLAPGQQTQPQVDLSGAFNDAGIVTDGSSFPSNGGLDGGGHALSYSFLGTSVVYNGNTFNLGPVGSNDVVTAAGQNIAVSAGTPYATLNLLAMAVNTTQTSQTFLVTFTDGNKQTITQSFSDWFTPNGYSNESKAVTMTYRDVYDRSTDNRPFYVYAYTLTLTPGERVQSITLPNNGNLRILAIALGAAVAPPAGTPVDLSGSFGSFGSKAISTDGTTFPNTDGFDGGGHAYSSTLLGSTVAWNNLTFNLGPVNANDDVEALGQTLSLPAGKYASLNFLAATPYNPVTNVTFTVTYSDATFDTFTRSFSTWTAPQSYSGESTAVTMTYQNNSSGGKNTLATYLYGYTFTLNTLKQVQSITLPNASSVKILAMTLAPVHTMAPVHSASLAPSTTSGATAASPSAGGSLPLSLVGERRAMDPSSSYSALFAFLSSVKGNGADQSLTRSAPPASSLSTSDLAFLPEYPNAFPHNSIAKKDNWDFQRHNFGLENSDES